MNITLMNAKLDRSGIFLANNNSNRLDILHICGHICAHFQINRRDEYDEDSRVDSSSNTAIHEQMVSRW